MYHRYHRIKRLGDPEEQERPLTIYTVPPKPPALSLIGSAEAQLPARIMCTRSTSSTRPGSFAPPSITVPPKLNAPCASSTAESSSDEIKIRTKLLKNEIRIDYAFIFWGDFLGFILDRICNVFGVKYYVLPKGIADYTIDEADGKPGF